MRSSASKPGSSIGIRPKALTASRMSGNCGTRSSGGGRAGSLVVGVDLLAEGVLGLVEDDRQVGRLDADRALADELVELGAEQAHAPRSAARRTGASCTSGPGSWTGSRRGRRRTSRRPGKPGRRLSADGRKARARPSARRSWSQTSWGLEIAERGRRRHRARAPSYGDPEPRTPPEFRSRPLGALSKYLPTAVFSCNLSSPASVSRLFPC